VVAAVTARLPRSAMMQIRCTQLLHRHIVTSRRCPGVNNAGRKSDLKQQDDVISQFVDVCFPLYFNTRLFFSSNDAIKFDDNNSDVIIPKRLK
jgi:hypothetical protein